MYPPYMKIKKPSKWLIGSRIKNMGEIYKTQYVAIREDDGEYTVLPSWWAKCLTIRRYKRLMEEQRLYSAEKNPYI